MFSLVAAKSITKVEDLKGKAMAVSNPLGIHAYVTLQILKKFGLDPGKDTRFLYLGEESSWVSAMETGLVAATFIQPPTSLVMKRKGYNILVNAGDYIELPVTGLSASVERMRIPPTLTPFCFRSAIGRQWQRWDSTEKSPRKTNVRRMLVRLGDLNEDTIWSD